MQTIESQIVSKYGPFLERNKFTILRVVVDYEHFGNEVVICASSHFHLKIVKDRGEFLAEISPGPGKPWYPFEDVLEIALGKKRHKVPLFARDPIQILDNTMLWVADAIQSNEAQIAALGQARAQKVAEDIFGSRKPSSA